MSIQFPYLHITGEYSLRFCPKLGRWRENPLFLEKLASAAEKQHYLWSLIEDGLVALRITGQPERGQYPGASDVMTVIH